MKAVIFILATLLLGSVGNPVAAGTVMLIDTDVSSSPDGNLNLGFTSASQAIYQGVQLNIEQGYTITQVEIYASNSDSFFSAPYGLTFSIQEPDASSLPTPNTALFATTTDITDTSADARWLSSGIVDWSLDAGSYWLTFKPDSGFTGLIPYDTVSSQGLVTASRSTSNSNWTLGGDSLVYGLRVTAEPSVVPLPAAAWLFISALGGLIVAKRKQLKA